MLQALFVFAAYFFLYVLRRKGYAAYEFTHRGGKPVRKQKGTFSTGSKLHVVA